MDTQPLQSTSPSDPPATFEIDFGPYAGRDVAFVAVADPGYLLELVREGVGSDGLRAEAARALALRARLVPPGEPWVGVSVPSLPAAGWPGTLPVAAVNPPASRVGPPSSGGQASMRVAGRSLRTTVARARPWQLGLVVAGAVGAAFLLQGRDPTAPVPVAQPMAAHSAPVPTLPARPAAAQYPAADTTGAPAALGSATVAEAGPPPPCGARVEGAIPAESATDYLDTFQAVEFEVVQAKDTGKVTFLNSRIPYAGAFYVAIFPDDYAAFPEPPATYLAGRCIVVQGTIETYRGAPQIVLRHPDDLRIIEEPPSAPAVPTRPVVEEPPSGPAAPIRPGVATVPSARPAR